MQYLDQKFITSKGGRAGWGRLPSMALVSTLHFISITPCIRFGTSRKPMSRKFEMDGGAGVFPNKTVQFCRSLTSHLIRRIKMDLSFLSGHLGGRYET